MKRSREPSPGGVQLLIQLAGAGAGIVLFVYLVGGLVLRFRIDALGLPGETTVALMSRETLIIAGARLLLISLLMGAVAVWLTWTLRSSTEPQAEEPRDAPGRFAGSPLAKALKHPVVPLAAVAVIIAAHVLYYWLWEPLSWPRRAVILVTAAVAVLAAVQITHRSDGDSFRLKSVGYFVVISVFSAALGVVRALGPPMDLTFAVVQLDDGARTSGYLLARSSDQTILVPDVEGAVGDRVVSIPTTKVTALRLYRQKRDARGVGPLGGQVPEPLVGRRSKGPLAPGVLDETRRSAKEIRESALWKYPPLLFPASMRYWRHEYTRFSGERPRRLSAKGAVPVSLRQLTEEPSVFQGRVVIVRGYVAAASTLQESTAKALRQFVAFDARRTGGARAVCVVAREPGHPLRSGWLVDVRAIVLAAGIFVNGSGDERPRVALACQAARRSPRTR